MAQLRQVLLSLWYWRQQVPCGTVKVGRTVPAAAFRIRSSVSVRNVSRFNDSLR
jgi:hypothetical protein